MKHRSHRPRAEREARSRLAKLAHEASLLCGSLVPMKRKCGKPNCRCTAGERHESLYLSIKIKGQRRLLYVPAPLEDMVRRAVQHHQGLRELVQQLSDIHVEHFLELKKELRL